MRGRKRAGEVKARETVRESDDLDFFDDVEFLAHFEDAQLRSALLDQLVQTRNAVRMTQAHIAEIMGTTQSAVSELESGATDPRLSTLQRYARAVGSQLQAHLKRGGVQDLLVSFYWQTAEALGSLGAAAAYLAPPPVEIETSYTGSRNAGDLLAKGPPVTRRVSDVLVSDIYGKVA